MASSSGGFSRTRSLSSAGKLSAGNISRPIKQTPPPTTLTPENSDAPFEPCAATASFLLYAQRNRVLVLHHDSFAIERRFDLHREDVIWIAVDNVSERGSGRLAVSYDAGNTAIVWDILSGAEISRFSAYEHIKAASFMRNGNIAFGNDQGNIILFEASTSEHISARTIFDPITAIAPSADCRTFAIGYLNGSILIATLQPSFTILHTLTTTRAPSKITGLAWHGSSSKQKTDMLATQTMDGDLRVWSVPKAPLHEAPTIIRVLQRAEYQYPSPCWFAWSKNGRIIQHADGETRAWDVRTKKVSWETIPTVDNVTGIANYGPSATMFTLSRDHGVQQYDLNPTGRPSLVATVKHVPSNTPPTPPVMLDNGKDFHSRGLGDSVSLPAVSDTGESSTDEGATRSPLQRIAREFDSLDALEDELRDKVMPLSPSSSRTSSVSSKSSGGRRRDRRYLYDRPDSSRAASTIGASTEFSSGTPVRPSHDSVSIRSASSRHSNSKYRASSLRNQVLRSPEEARGTVSLDLFPNARTRLRDVPFRTPHYGNVARTPELLQREMLSVLFGWNDTARSLIRDEMQRHKAGSPAAVLLAKWLGDPAADHMSSMFGSESMSSADWMMLALNAIGVDSQKQVGEAFAQRLLEKGDVHPAVGILLGLGEINDAIEIYVAQKFWLEAVLLTCVACPSDWQRISYLIRKWGETAVQFGQADLAIRCFSCTSIETSEPWFSPRAQDAAYGAQQERLTRPPSAGPPLASPPLSPPSRSGSQRLAQKNASLKLITTFGDKGIPVTSSLDAITPMNAMGVTPIAQSALPYSALSPGGQDVWQQRQRNFRDPSSARTATPGGYSKKRLPSRSGDIERVDENMATPVTAARDVPPPLPGTSRRTSSIGSVSTADALQPTVYSDRLAPTSAIQLPSPSAGAFRLRGNSQGRGPTSKDRKPDGLQVQIMDTRYSGNVMPGPGSSKSQVTHSTQATAVSPVSTKSGRGRSIDEYLIGVEEAKEEAREKRANSKRREASKKRDGSRSKRGSSRQRDAFDTLSQHSGRYIQPGKRSPSSPVPMSPEEIALATQATKAEPATSEDESFYKVASPIEPPKDLRSLGLQPSHEQATADQATKGMDLEDLRKSSSRADSARGRSSLRQPGSTARSPSSPLPMQNETQPTGDREETNSDGRCIRLRAGSQNSESARSRRGPSRERRDRSSGRRPAMTDDGPGLPMSTVSKTSAAGSSAVGSAVSGATDNSIPRPRGLTKALAQKELEERRLSLARRPSAPTIPLPGESQTLMVRPSLGPRSNTESSPTYFNPPHLRSQTVDPEAMARYGRQTGLYNSSVPVGLPATPRAMRHPRYMSSDPNDRDYAPPVPELPDSTSNLSSLGSSLSQLSNSNLGSMAPSHLTSNLTSNLMSNLTSNASYLASNVSYDSSSALSSQVSSNPQIYDEDNLGPLLPSTVYGQKVPFRAASAPPEKSGAGVHPMYKPTLPHSSRRNSHVRKISPPETQNDRAGPMAPVASIDEALAAKTDQRVLFVDNDAPPILPELQHLAGPPPPPPPPKPFPIDTQGNGSGLISIAIDDNAPNSAVDAPTMLPSTSYIPPNDRGMTASPMERATTASPSAHRRGRGSVTDAFGSRFRDFGERMRSTSRNRTKSPGDYRTLPYESVLPPMPSHHHHRHDSEQRAKSPYEQAMAMQNQGAMMPPPPPPPMLPETSIPPSTLPRSASAQGGYRNPKEIRANMPPETLQSGVYPGTSTYL